MEAALNNVRQTVRGTTYDTTESEFVASATNFDDDDMSFDVALYRTVTGEWFLVLSSDERSRASVTPLTSQQAEQWCVENGMDAPLRRFYFDPRSVATAARPVAALLRDREVWSA